MPKPAINLIGVVINGMKPEPRQLLNKFRETELKNIFIVSCNNYLKSLSVIMTPSL